MLKLSILEYLCEESYKLEDSVISNIKTTYKEFDEKTNIFDKISLISDILKNSEKNFNISKEEMEKLYLDISVKLNENKELLDKIDLNDEKTIVDEDLLKFIIPFADNNKFNFKFILFILHFLCKNKFKIKSFAGDQNFIINILYNNIYFYEKIILLYKNDSPLSILIEKYGQHPITIVNEEDENELLKLVAKILLIIKEYGLLFNNK